VRNPASRHSGFPTSASPAHGRLWRPQFARRVREGFLRTVVSISCLTAVFFAAYFGVQRHPAYVPVVMPLTWLDMIVPFQPAALVAYVSLWIYVGVGPGLQRTIADFAVYLLWLSALCLCGLAIFFFWPTQAPVRLALATHFPGFAVLHRVDLTSNACPSMHVAVAIFTAVRVEDVLRSLGAPRWLRMANLAWFLVIAYSTLATKQHVALDVVAGALLGVLIAVMSLRWRPGEARQASFATVAVPP